MSAVLFDLDGTLIDTAADFIRIIQAMCREEQRDVVDADLIRTQVSEGARAMVRLVYPELAVDDATFLAHRQRFLDLYEQDIVVDTDLFSGMTSLLEQLEAQQIPWGIVTNKPRYLTELLLKRLDLTERCAVLVCPEDVKHAKPDPEPMFLAAEQLQVPPSKLFMWVIIRVISMQDAQPTCIRFWPLMVTYRPPTKTIWRPGKPMRLCTQLQNWKQKFCSSGFKIKSTEQMQQHA